MSCDIRNCDQPHVIKVGSSPGMRVCHDHVMQVTRIVREDEPGPCGWMWRQIYAVVDLIQPRSKVEIAETTRIRNILKRRGFWQ